MNRYQWQETAPGHFEQHADGLEVASIFVNTMALAIRERFAILAGVTINHAFDDIVPRLKNAWLSMRYHHPSLVVIVESEKVVYRVPSGTELSEWLSRTFIVTTRLPNNELPPIGEGREATLYFIPETNELVLHCPHDRLDGHGALHLFNNILKAVLKPPVINFGDEMRNLSPSLRIAAKSPPVTPAHINALLDSFRASGAVRGSAGLVAASPMGSGKFRRTFTTLPIEDTLSIVKTTRSLGFTVTHATHAALIIATDILGEGNKIYAISMAQNLRPGLYPPFNNAGDHPAACYFYPNPFIVDGPMDFNSVTTQIKSAYKERTSDSAVTKAIAFGESLSDILPTMATKTAIPCSIPTLSSMGIIDGIFSAETPDLTISSPWLTTDDVSPDISGHMWTWHGQMTISLGYNEACFSREAMRKLLQVTIGVLATNLHLEPQPTFD
jgi:hypothetical protein